MAKKHFEFYFTENSITMSLFAAKEEKRDPEEDGDDGDDAPVVSLMLVTLRIVK